MRPGPACEAKIPSRTVAVQAIEAKIDGYGLGVSRVIPQKYGLRPDQYP
jgi:hypothetical protein